MIRLGLPIVVLAALVAFSVLTDRPLPPADAVVINRGDLSTLDPQRQSWMPDMRVGRLVFEGLVRHDPFTPGFDPTPAAASSWEVSESGRVYTFSIREDARWSNGEPVRAQDFVYAWRRALLPDTAAQYTSLFFHIRGARAFFDWRREQLDDFESGRSAFDSAETLWQSTRERFNQTVAVKAIDDRTLRVELVRPLPYFLDLCAMSPFSPVYPPLLRAHERVDPATGWRLTEHGWTKPPRLVSNGPFEVVEWRFKRDLYLRANPHHWDEANLGVRTIHIPTIEDINAQVLAYQTGSVDWVSDVSVGYRGDMLARKLEFYEEHRDAVDALRAQGLDPFELDRRLPDDPRKDIHVVPAFGTYFWNFNCAPSLPDGRANPFADARVRRAFALAIDKAAISREIRRLGEPVARTLIPTGSIGGYVSPAGLGFDPDAARALLAEAGYPDGEGLITIELLFNKDAGHDLIGQAIAKDWQKHLGVRTRLVQKELKIYRFDLDQHRFMTSRAGWFGDYGDPTTFLDLNKTGDTQNDRQYSNPEYDALLARAETETDPAARMALLAEAERIVMEIDVPMVPIFHYCNTYLFDADEWSGITPHPRTSQKLYLLDRLGDGVGRDTPRTLPYDHSRGGSDSSGGSTN